MGPCSDCHTDWWAWLALVSVTVFLFVFWGGVAYGAYKLVGVVSPDSRHVSCTYSGVDMHHFYGTSSAVCVSK